jgi:hypothetical protein
MLSKTKGTKFSELPAHIQHTLKLIINLRKTNNSLFKGYEDILKNFHFSGQILFRAKRNILLATPSMQGHFSYATDMSYERANRLGNQWILNCLNDILATIELQGKYKTMVVQEEIHYEPNCGEYMLFPNSVRVWIENDYGRAYRGHIESLNPIPLTQIFEEKYNTEILHYSAIGTKYLPNEDSEFIGDEDDRIPHMEYVLFVPIT